MTAGKGASSKSTEYRSVQQSSKRDVKDNKMKECPELSAGCFSALSFTWMQSLIRLAGRKVLDLEDIPDICESDKTHVWKEAFDKCWAHELKRCGISTSDYGSLDEIIATSTSTSGSVPKKRPSVFRAIAQQFGCPFMCAGILKLFHDALQYSLPVFINLTIEFFEQGGTETLGSTGFKMGYFWAICLFVSRLTQSLFINHYFHRVYRIGMQVRAFVILGVYGKVLRLSPSAKVSSGKIVNLVSNDAARIMRFTPYLHNMWSAPFQIIVAFTQLYIYIGPSGFVGLLVMLIVIPVKARLVRILEGIRKRVVKKTDARVKLITDVVQGIKVVKFYSWESSFTARISETRAKEMAILFRHIIVQMINYTIWNLTPMLVTLSVFAVYALTGGEMKASVIFAALSIFRLVRFPIIVLPFIINAFINFKVASARISKFLCLSEIYKLDKLEDSSENCLVLDNVTFIWRKREKKDDDSEKKTKESEDTKETKDETKESQTAKIEPKKIDKDENETESTIGFSLSSINLAVKQGDLVAVCGAVGSGKSSLLAGMLGEMEMRDGLVRRKGTVAFVPQTAWIVNATVQENICMVRDDSKFNPSDYDEAVKVSQLSHDLKLLPAGDQTEIGEKGINLSGGQKTRIALARACYANNDLYIFDDPLSALDAHVGRAVFDDLICKKLKGKTRILATHQLHLLPHCDRIIVLKEGRIVDDGAFADLIERSSDFKELMENHGVEEEEEDEVALSKSKLKKEDGQDFSEGKKTTQKDKTNHVGAGLSGQLVKEDARQIGGVQLAVLATYFRMFARKPMQSVSVDDFSKNSQRTSSTSACCVITFILVVFSVQQAAAIYTNIWLTFWTDDVADPNGPNNSTGYYLGIFAALTLSALLVYFCSQLIFAVGGLRAATNLHNELLSSLLRAPMSLFETVPSGRILSRCSQDVDLADNQLREAMSTMIRCFVEVLGTFGLIVYVTGPWMILPLIPIIIGYYFILQFYRQTSRELKRIDSLTSSPIFSHLSETLAGLSSIRSFQVQSQFAGRNSWLIDTNHRAYFHANAANRWLSFRLEALGSLLVCATAVVCLSVLSADDAPMLGLALVYVTQVMGTLSWGVRQVAETETHMNAVERLLEYVDGPNNPSGGFELEAANHMPNDPESTAWPLKGSICFKGLKLRYRPNLPLALRGVHAEIKGGEKIGVCGRTGSGKSSLLVALFRLVEATEGEIIVDGRNISQLGLNTLRSRLAIIPQDPILFVGTVRTNLDPFHKRTDVEVWEALRRCHMAKQIEGRDGQLSSPVAEGGKNFSVGERQLLCLGRALLRGCKILALDEATASVDYDTDTLIQATIRREFADCTCIFIAHRLTTIIDCDRILVMDDGVVAEFASPKELVEKKDSIFSSLLNECDATAEKLKRVARGQEKNLVFSDIFIVNSSKKSYLFMKFKEKEVVGGAGIVRLGEILFQFSFLLVLYFLFSFAQSKLEHGSTIHDLFGSFENVKQLLIQSSPITRMAKVSPGEEEVLFDVTELLSVLFCYSAILSFETLLRLIFLYGITSRFAFIRAPSRLLLVLFPEDREGLSRQRFSLSPNGASSWSHATQQEKQGSNGHTDGNHNRNFLSPTESQKDKNARNESIIWGKASDVAHLHLWGIELFVIRLSTRLLAFLLSVLLTFRLEAEAANWTMNVVKTVAFFRIFIPLQGESGLLIHDVLYSLHLGSDQNFKSAASFASLVIRVCVILFGITLGLGVLGYDISNMVTGIGIGGLTVGLALQQTMSNLFACIQLLLDRPFKVGDFVNVDGCWGKVVHIGFRCTVIKKTSGERVHMPNQKLTTAVIQNCADLSAGIDKRKVCLYFVLPPTTSVEKLEKLLPIAKQAVEGVSEVELCLMCFEDFVENGLKYQFRFTTPGDATKWRAKRQIVVHKFLKGLENEEIRISVPGKEVGDAIMSWKKVNDEVYVVWTYAYLPLLVLLGISAEFVGYRPIILLGAFGRLATRILLLLGGSLFAMQLMQVTYAVGSVGEVVFFAYIFHSVRSEGEYQKVQSLVQFSYLVAHVAGGIFGDLLLHAFSWSIRSLFWVSFLMVSLACIIAVTCFKRVDHSGAVVDRGAEMESLQGISVLLHSLYETFSPKRVQSMEFLLLTCYFCAANSVYQLANGYESSLYLDLTSTSNQIKKATDNDYNGSFYAAAVLLGSVAALVPAIPKLEYWHQLTTRCMIISTAFGVSALLCLSLTAESSDGSGGSTVDIWSANVILALVCFAGYVVCWQYAAAVYAAEAARRSKNRVFASVFVATNVVSLLLQSVVQTLITHGEIAPTTADKYTTLSFILLVFWFIYAIGSGFLKFRSS
eukprot:g3569.t1